MNRARVRSAGFAILAIVVLLVAVPANAEPPAVGAQVPDFTLPTLDGEAVTLSERVGEGPVVLVFFRGAW